MKKQKTRQIPQYRKANRSAQSVEALQSELHRLNKLADQRLRNLEKAAGRDGYYNDILNYSYRTAMHDIKEMRGEGFTRFDTTKLPTNINSLRSQINKVESFLDAPTSTITGIRNVYIERINSFNAANGTNFTWQQFANFIESDMWEKMNQKFGSTTAIQATTESPKQIKDVINDIVEHDKRFGKSKNETILKGIRKKDIQDYIKTSKDLTKREKEYLNVFVENTKLSDLKSFY